VLPLLEAIVQAGKPLLIIAEDIAVGFQHEPMPEVPGPEQRMLRQRLSSLQLEERRTLMHRHWQAWSVAAATVKTLGPARTPTPPPRQVVSASLLNAGQHKCPNYQRITRCKRF
jgi:hypothetical protein